MIRRFCAGTALCLAVAFLLAACGASAVADGPASGARTSSPTAPTAAQNLRVSIDLVLGTHVMLLARTTDAALGVRTIEFATYGTQLHANTAAVASTVAPGQDSQAQNNVGNALTLYDRDVLSDVTATYSKNPAQQQQAQGDLSTTYVSQMQSALQQSTHAPSSMLTKQLDQQVADAEALVTAQASGDWPSAYSSLSTAYAHSIAFGTLLAEAMARTAPRTYPGNPVSKAADLHATVETQLQAGTYLLGMAESAAAGNRTSEEQAATTAYGDSTTAVGQAIAPAGAALSRGITGLLAQAQTAAAGLAAATAQKNTGAVGTNQNALTLTLPQDYLVIAQGQLGIAQGQAQAASRAFGAALVAQASAEGLQQGTPQLGESAASTGATLGGQWSSAISSRYGSAFPNT